MCVEIIESLLEAKDCNEEVWHITILSKNDSFIQKPFCQGLRSQLVERNCLDSCRKPSTMFKSKLVHIVFLWWLNEREVEGSLVQEQIQEILTKRQEPGCAKNMFHDPIFAAKQSLPRRPKGQTDPNML